jgi:hypothetical protein
LITSSYIRFLIAFLVSPHMKHLKTKNLHRNFNYYCITCTYLHPGSFIYMYCTFTQFCLFYIFTYYYFSPLGVWTITISINIFNFVKGMVHKIDPKKTMSPINGILVIKSRNFFTHYDSLVTNTNVVKEFMHMFCTYT